jgi:L-alanine-DL-glutamate epimerase-like enolase superfamily enzyme
MKVESIRAWASDVPLTRPYAISGGSWDSVEMAFCELRTDDGLVGHGM